MVYVKNSLSYQHIKELDFKLETIWIKIKLRKGKSFLLCIIYRPPNSTADSFDSVSVMMSKALDFEM